MKACFIIRNGNTWEIKKKNIDKDGVVKFAKNRKVMIGQPTDDENKKLTGMIKGWKLEDSILGKWYPLYFVSGDRALPLVYVEPKHEPNQKEGFSLKTMSQENFSNFLEGKVEAQLTTIKKEPFDMIFYMIIGAVVGASVGFMIAGGDLSGIVSTANFVPLCLSLTGIKELKNNLQSSMWKHHEKE